MDFAATKEDVATWADTLAAQLSSAYTTYDFSKASVLRSLLVEPNAWFGATVAAELEKIKSTLLFAGTGTGTADDALVDLLMQAFGKVRAAGSKARGLIQLTFSRSGSYRIPQSSTFTTDTEIVFTSESSYLVTPTVSGAANELQLVAHGGVYVCQLPMVCAVTGTVGNVKAGTPVTWASPLSGFVAAEVVVSNGGEDAESNESLLARRDISLTAPVFGGRANIRALIEQVYPAVIESAVFGMSSAEVIRNGHNAFGIKTGQYADVFVRTARRLTFKTFELEARLLDAATGTMSVTVPAAAFPGAYAISAINRTAAEVDSLPITALITLIDSANHAFTTPFNTTADDLRYYPYRTRVVTFTDPAGVDGLSYLVTMYGIPDTEQILETILADDARPYGLDVTVSAPFPVLLDVGIQAYGVLTEAQSIGIQAAVTTAVENMRFGAPAAYAAVIIEAAQAAAPSGVTIKVPVSLTGTYVAPDGTTTTRRSSSEIQAWNDASLGASKKNTSFFLRTCQIEPVTV